MLCPTIAASLLSWRGLRIVIKFCFNHSSSLGWWSNDLLPNILWREQVSHSAQAWQTAPSLANFESVMHLSGGLGQYMPESFNPSFIQQKLLPTKSEILFHFSNLILEPPSACAGLRPRPFMICCGYKMVKRAPQSRLDPEGGTSFVFGLWRNLIKSRRYTFRSSFRKFKFMTVRT